MVLCNKKTYLSAGTELLILNEWIDACVLKKSICLYYDVFVSWTVASEPLVTQVTDSQEHVNSLEDNDHLSQHKQPVDKAVYSCSHCEATFKQKLQLASHMTVHTGEKVFLFNIGCVMHFVNVILINVPVNCMSLKEGPKFMK